MPTPIAWNSTNEPLCGENDPYGRDDTANRYARGWWANFCAEHHPADGTHTTGGLMQTVRGSYTSRAGRQTILLGPPLAITLILIVARGAYAPVLAMSSMPAGQSKLFLTADLQPNHITDLATPGQFTVGTADAVNAQSATVTYDYCVIGV
jgi:hypothetical protein